MISQEERENHTKDDTVDNRASEVKKHSFLCNTFLPFMTSSSFVLLLKRKPH
jgi:hypothetical protein